jgi:hypothetical protein
VTPKIGLGPVVDGNSRILILGSLPGEESLRQQRYYSDPRNHFWSLLSGVFGEPVAAGYPERLASSRIMASRCGTFSVAPSDPEAVTRRSASRSRTTFGSCFTSFLRSDASHSTARKLKPCGVRTSGQGRTSRMSRSSHGWSRRRVVVPVGMSSHSRRNSFFGGKSFAPDWARTHAGSGWGSRGR